MQVSRGRKPSPPLVTAKQIALNAQRLDATVAKYNGNIIMAQNAIQDAVTQTGMEALAMGMLADTEEGERRGRSALFSAGIDRMKESGDTEEDIGRKALNLGKAVTNLSAGLKVFGSIAGTVANAWEANKDKKDKEGPSKDIELSKVLSDDAKELVTGPRDQRDTAGAGVWTDKMISDLGKAKAKEIPDFQGKRLDEALATLTNAFEKGEGQRSSPIPDADTLRRGAPSEMERLQPRPTEGAEPIEADFNLPRMDAEQPDLRLAREDHDRNMVDALTRLNTPFERGEGQRSSPIPDADALRRGAPRDPLALPSARGPLGEEEMGADILRHTDTLDEHNLQAQKLDDAIGVINNAFSRSGSRTAAPMNPELLKWKEQLNQGALDQMIWNLSSGRR